LLRFAPRRELEYAFSAKVSALPEEIPWPKIKMFAVR